MQGAFDVYRKCVEALEGNHTYKVKCLCEPQFGKRGLYPAFNKSVYDMFNFVAYADGGNDLIGISDKIGVPPAELIYLASRLVDENLLERV